MAAAVIKDSIRLMSLDEQGGLAMKVSYTRYKAVPREYLVTLRVDGHLDGEWVTPDGMEDDLPFIVVGRRPADPSARFPHNVWWGSVDELKGLACSVLCRGGNQWRPISVAIICNSTTSVAWEENDDIDFEDEFVSSSDDDDEDDDDEDEENDEDDEEDGGEEDEDEDDDEEEEEGDVAGHVRKRSRLGNYTLLFWVLIGCTVVTVIVTVLMMYRMSQKPTGPLPAPPAHTVTRPPAPVQAPRADTFSGESDEMGEMGEMGEIEEIEEIEETFKGQTDMVYIYSETCGWCDRFNPIWADFSDRYSGPINLVKVEARNPDARKYNVSGYPTVIIMKDGTQTAVFKDDRTVENLIRFASTNE
ncbi:hypothetical protein TSOC_012999 [Tetrabaena socialis]|uniref:Thioredoxin domain-containing protein n=1 Tax=Tetrabaena socialis TaxID=47790 RepID=A0A2J7ZJB4_9CHLO|nr:hypothetical protein TSOC_013821 [Tetrabaena socialis]PNH01129.1 hypothetical protein TSOC_012999 [Tetrabaena socialis]|eukprot:PNH00362.1 hypothetical protein TSOC_013821 [Tetrabaena socialis]